VRALRVLVFGLSLPVSGLLAQEPPRPLTGEVRDEADQPIRGANVFLLETLEGDLTGADGTFSIETRHTGPATLVVRHLTYAEHRVDLVMPRPEPVEVSLLELVQADAIVVTAGGYTAGDEAGATLTSLEVVTTPGTNADVAGAIKTLPGVQNVDEGNGLFVRGGDRMETKLFLDDAVVIDPLRLEEPTGSITPTVDPFLLDGIFFSSGGFGARYGNALSAIVDLETQGRPRNRHVNLGANLAGANASVGFPIGPNLGAHATVNRWHVGPIFAVNGSTRDYPVPPQGFDLSGSLIWSYRPDGEWKTFAIRQSSDLEVEIDEASFTGSYTLDEEGSIVVSSWQERFDRVALRVSVSRSTLARSERSGALDLESETTLSQVFGEVAWSPADRFVVTAGGEVERLASDVLGHVPATASDLSGDGDAVPIDFDDAVSRAGAFAEGELRLAGRVRVRTGLRTDRSTQTDERTWDPRVSVDMGLGKSATLLLAWGIYHQVPDPLFFEASLGDPGLPAMRSRQLVAGIQLGSPEDALVRVEAYDKRYDDLALVVRDGRVVGGGEGSSRGLDLFLKGPLVWGIDGRAAYSLVDAERTDPDTELLARSPLDVTHSLTLVGARRLAVGWSLRAAYRYATGRPFTDVVDATFDPEEGVFVPEFGDPFVERLPDYHRLDLAASHIRRIGRWQAVFYASLGNVFDRENVLEFRWSEDYSERFPVRSRSKRSVFFGVSLDL
jgi:hypothetical protein